VYARAIVEILKTLITHKYYIGEEVGDDLSNIILGQNIIGRLTHGLVGIDIFTQEKRENPYLKDFLSLKAQEINEALTSVSARRLVPNTHRVTFEESTDLLKKILQAQKVIEHIDKADPKDIDAAKLNLIRATRLFYALYHR
jgi:DNA-directed RNA polymerase subunit H (RpoH/RPB5)